jgi:formylglycine-generating enzyme required for sulfatase activity
MSKGGEKNLLEPSFFSRMGGGKESVKDSSDAELERFPVENVSWNDAQLFVKRLNSLVQEPGWTYRLPTEVEWEYACRGGPLADQFTSGFDFYFDEPTNKVEPGQANMKHEKWLNRTCKVGSFRPNALGLYDMHGNVAEWCQDADPKLVDPKGAPHRAYRGSSWNDLPVDWRASSRNIAEPDHRLNDRGLRLARVPVDK